MPRASVPAYDTRARRRNPETRRRTFTIGGGEGGILTAFAGRCCVLLEKTSESR
jgi:hypothetical protein